MRKIREVLVCLIDRRWSERRTAQFMGVGRATVSEYRQRFTASNLSWPLNADLDDDALERALFPNALRTPGVPAEQIDFAWVLTELAKKGATLGTVHEDWCKKTPPENQLGYQHFCRRVSDYKSSLHISMRRIRVPGEETEVDYAGKTMPIVDAESGVIRQAQIFVGALGYSNFSFCEATWTQGLPDWIESHVRMWEFFGGATEIVVPDNLKSGVTTPERYDPLINESYNTMLRHYQCLCLPARSGRPKDKPKGEGSVGLVTRWILFRLRNRTFYTLHDLNVEIRKGLDMLNERKFQKRPGSRLSNWLEIEKPALKPLPLERYEFAEIGRVRAGIDYCVTVDKHAYSVPYEHRRLEFDYSLTASKLDLTLRNKHVVTHVRSYIAGGATILPQHMPPEHNVVANWSRDESLAWATEIGPATKCILEFKLSKTNNKHFGYRATNSMKRLASKYPPKRFEQACSYCLAYKIFDVPGIQRVLSMDLDRLLSGESIDEPSENTQKDRSHENIRGAQHYANIIATQKGGQL